MMQPWFPEAKLGIFIHWGIYAVRGIGESWSWYNGEISRADYFGQLDGFTAAGWDPDAWAALFERAGARYAVLTAKHHDGVALWDTRQGDLSVAARSPARRDLVGPYCEALRRRGLHVGLYVSHLDWAHPDYASIRPPWHTGAAGDRHRLSEATGPDNPARWAKFLAFHRAQLEELCTRYRPELLWFDGDWERSAEQWDMPGLREQLHRWAPGVILNSRMQGAGDYATPEQAVPILPPKGPWEFCMTINDSWGFQPRDRNWKSTRQIVRIFAETIGMGGNLLLDVGPKPDGTIPEEQVERLEDLGRWIAKHAEAVHGTVAGLPAGHVHGSSTLSADRTVLYVFLFDRPWDEIAIKGIRNRIKAVTVLGSNAPLPHRVLGGMPHLKLPGILWVGVPEAVLDRNATVLKIVLDGPLDLYREAGSVITQN